MVNKLPEGWQELTLEQLTKNMVDGPFGSDLKKVHYTENREARIIQLSNIGEDGWKDDNVKYTTFNHANKLKRCIVAYPNVVVAKMMPAGRAMLCPDKEAMYVLSSDAVKIVVDEDIIMPEYFVYATKTSFFQEQIDNDTQGSTRQRTSIKKLRKNSLLVPQLAEQKKIVKVLSDVDNLIADLELQVEKDRNLKQACLAHLFSREGQIEPDVRLPGFYDGWNKHKLVDLTDEFKSGTSISADDIYEQGTYPVYGGNGIRGYTETYTHDGEYAIIGRQGALCGNMNFSKGKVYLTEHAIAVKANKLNDTKFLYYLCTQMNLGQYSGQSAQPGLAVNKLHKLDTHAPEISEQISIATLLSDIDNAIIATNKKTQKYRSFKQGMMEQLLTGRIRL